MIASRFLKPPEKNEMKKFTLLLLLILLLPSPVAFADGAGLMISRRAKADFALTADPNAKAWRSVKGIVSDRNRRGQVVPNHRTEIRSQWTEKYLYFLFICPYEELNLKPDPSVTGETNKLWEWDVAEVFIGTDFDDIRHYTEYQVSPQGEWVDLDIDRKPQPAVHDVEWNSGFEVKARIDQARKSWYGEMKIPMEKLDRRPAAAGNLMRINFYRLQGPGPNRKDIAWQPTNSNSNHVPESFGRLKLEK
jgi:hypothetical protein